jgi:beta-galactosidase
VRCFKGSNLLEDVYTYNDFVYDGEQIPLEPRKNVAKKQVPYLVTEYNGHKYPTKKFDDDAHRAEHAMRHLEVLNAMYKSEDIAGCIGWCMFDYNTHKDFGSGDKICYHGVMDMFRIPKYAAATYSSQQDTKPVMEITSSMNAGDMEGSIRGDVTILTNCDYVNLYINDKFIKKYYPLKDKYPNLPHPPIVVDDFIGDLIEQNEKFSKNDARLIKKILIKVDKAGGKIALLDKLQLGYLFVKYKMNMLDGEKLYLKYFGGWGTASTQYRFVGYKNDVCVIKKTKSQVFDPMLQVDVDSSTLVEDKTYDVTRFVVKLVDEHNETLHYANDVISVETEGPVEVIGPKMLSLIGGSIGFWVKSTGGSSEATVNVVSERFGVITQKLVVKKK